MKQAPDASVERLLCVWFISVSLIGLYNSGLWLYPDTYWHACSIAQKELHNIYIVEI